MDGAGGEAVTGALSTAPRPRPRGRLGLARLLPRGVPLPSDAWRRRHDALLVGLWVLLIVVVMIAAVVALLTSQGHHASAPALAGALAVALTCLTRRDDASSHREIDSSLLTFGLLWCSAITVDLADGRAESYYLFFVVVAAATLYQSWAPFLTCVAFIVVHLGIIGSLVPRVVYGRDSTVENPWLWATMHITVLVLAAAVGIAAWASDEGVRARFAGLAERSELVLATVADGIAVIDADGRVVQANPAAYALLGVDPVGRTLSGLFQPDSECPASTTFGDLLAAAVAGTAVSRLPLQARVDGRPLEVTLRPVGEDRGDVSAVLSVRDMLAQRRAEQAERSLVSARQREADQRRAATELAAAFRPTPLDLPDAEIGVTYLPAQSAPAGGDSYDLCLLPDGAVQVVVVDAMGSGLPAMRQALAVTATIRTLTLADCPLSALLARTARLLEREDDELVATVLVARYWPRTGEVRLAGAGHPPAMLSRLGHRAVEVEAPGVPIGYPGGGSDRVVELLLTPGDTLLLYTDGLIEGTRDVLEGLAALADACTTGAAVDPQLLTDSLIRDLSTCARHQDDCLALALRRPVGAALASLPADAVATVSSAQQHLSLPADPASVPLARRFAVRQARDHGVAEDVCDSLALLVTELTTNAVLHARTPVSLRVEVTDTAVLVGIDDGDSRIPQQRVSDDDATSGRGLALVAALASEWGTRRHEGGKVVWFRLARTGASMAS